jgi:hypothetical protein
MKKKYVSPHSMVVTIATTQFLCNSIPTGDNPYNGGKILSPRRRGQANWEDEEDDEDF